MDNLIYETATIPWEPVWDIGFHGQGEQDGSTYYGNAEIAGDWFPGYESPQPLSYTNDAAPEHLATIHQPVGSVDELSAEHWTNFMFTQSFPQSQAQSSLSMSKISSIESAPQDQAGRSMAISDVSVVFQQVPQPSVATREPSLGPIEPCNSACEIIDLTSQPSKSSLDADVNTKTLPVDMHDTTDSTLKHGRQVNDCPGRESKSSSPTPQVYKTTQDSSRKFSRRIDFEELIVQAAAHKKRKLSNEACTDDAMDTQENLKSPMLSKTVFSTNNIPSVEHSSAKAVSSTLEEGTNHSPRVSGPAQSLSVRKSSYTAKITQHSGTVAEPIDIDELSDSGDNEGMARQATDEDQDLMHHAFQRDNEQVTTDVHEKTISNNLRPRSGQRKSPRRGHSSRSQPGFYNWKGTVDKIVNELEDLWHDVQSRWIVVRDSETMNRGPFMTGFHEKLCKTSETWTRTGFCSSDLHPLAERWAREEGVISTQLEHKNDIKLLDSFTEALNSFLKASGQVADGDVTMSAALDGDDEDDQDWSPSVE